MSERGHRSRAGDGGVVAPETLVTGRVAAERWRPGAANPARGKIQRSEASSGRCCGVAGVAGERRNRPAPVAAEMCPGRERGLWEREVEGWGGA